MANSSNSRNMQPGGKGAWLWLNGLGALFVFIVALVTYLRTMAPTVSFWDCGEFIACSFILGIPHPPGSPFFIILGRLFSMLPFGSEVAWRLNLFSVFSSAVTVMLVYLVVVRSIRMWRGQPESLADQLLLLAGGLAGALLLTFSDTFWFNAVETEVYGLAMLLMTLCTWLALVWLERREQPGSTNFLLLIIYLMFLGIGNHMFSLLMAPALFLLVIVTLEEVRHWPVLGLMIVMGFLLTSLIYSIEWFALGTVLGGLALWLFRDKVPWTVPVLAGGVSGLVLLVDGGGTGLEALDKTVDLGWFVFEWRVLLIITLLVSLALFFAARIAERQTRFNWRFWVVAAVMAVIGYTVHLYIPIRSHLDPIIDENDPDNWTRLEAFLERKQYGQESMLVTMFKRRGSLASQFGDGKNMGFWGFFKRQFSRPDRGLWVVPVFLGLFGLVTQWRRNRDTAAFLTALLVICSLGLIWYMNFSDGSRGVQREVRERDYFFTPAFVCFAMLMGIGVGGLLDRLQAWAARLSLASRTNLGKLALVTGVAGILVVGYSYWLFNHHFETHDRTGNYMPYDYAYNILQSCEKEAILFTNGDNDTFPLWFLQEVEGVRRDVRVVNLSLLNTPWYIKQLKHRQPKIPMTLSDEEIEGLTVIRWPKPTTVQVAGLSWTLTAPASHPQLGPYLRVQDYMALNIIHATHWQRPVYFAVTVSNDNKLGLDDYLTMEGLVFRINQKRGLAFDVARARRNLFEVYRYRGIRDPEVHKDDTTRKLLGNYAVAFQQLALSYYQVGQSDEAINAVRRYVDVIGMERWAVSFMVELYGRSNQLDKAGSLLEEAIATNPAVVDYYLNLSTIYQRQGQSKRAIAVMEQARDRHPDQRRAYEQLAALYQDQGDVNATVQVLQQWLSRHPNDTTFQRRLEALR